jgi:hypothetical protein
MGCRDGLTCGVGCKGSKFVFLYDVAGGCMRGE